MNAKTLGIVLLLLVATASFLLPVDAAATAWHEENLKRALAAFGIAKGLNGLISMIQGTEISFTPVGIGVTLTVGELLDPLNDMVERFSWVMLVAGVSLGIQKMLVALGAKGAVKGLLAFAAMLAALTLWRGPSRGFAAGRFVWAFLVFALLLRFGAVAFLYMEKTLYESLLAPQYESSLAALEKVRTRLEETRTEMSAISTKKPPAAESEQNSWMPDFIEEYSRRLGEEVEAIRKKMDLQRRFEALGRTLDDAYAEIINLMTIFVVTTLLMPLLFLWLAWGAVRLVFLGLPGMESIRKRRENG